MGREENDMRNIKAGALIIAAASSLTLTGCAFLAPLDEPSAEPGETIESARPEPTEEPSAESAAQVSPEDLEVTLTVTDKQCFGTAGCNITVEPSLAFTDDAAGAGTYSVTYEIKGDESGPIVQTLEVADGQYEYFPVSASTESGDVKLTAEVTSVRY